jgi:hypothetical protein
MAWWPTARIVEIDKKGKTQDKGWTRAQAAHRRPYLAKKHAAIEAQQAALEATANSLAALEE